MGRCKCNCECKKPKSHKHSSKSLSKSIDVVNADNVEQVNDGKTDSIDKVDKVDHVDKVSPTNDDNVIVPVVNNNLDEIKARLTSIIAELYKRLDTPLINILILFMILKIIVSLLF
jgi:hypothetical protein